MPRDKLASAEKQRTIPDAYSALLNEPAQGHALWDPRQVVNGGGTLGDIGIISNGVFHKQWNVYMKLPDGVPLLKKQPYRDGDRYYPDILQSGDGAKISFHGTVSADPASAALTVPLPLSSVSVTPKLSSQHDNYAYLAPVQPAFIDEESYDQVHNLSHWFYANSRHFHKGSVLITAVVRARRWLSGISLTKSSSRSLEAGASVSFAEATVGGSKDTNKWNVIHKRSPGGASDYTLILRYIAALSRAERLAYKLKSTFNPPSMPALIDPCLTTTTSSTIQAKASDQPGPLSDVGVAGSTERNPFGLSTMRLVGDEASDIRYSGGSSRLDDGLTSPTSDEAGASNTSNSVSVDDVAAIVGVDLRAGELGENALVSEPVYLEGDHSLLHEMLAHTLDDGENQNIDVAVGDWSIISEYQKNYQAMPTSDMLNISADLSRPRDAQGKTTESVAFVTTLASDDPHQLRSYYASTGLDVTSEIWFTPWASPRITGVIADIYIGIRIISILAFVRYAASIASFGRIEAGEQVAVKILKMSNETFKTAERRNDIRRMRRQVSVWRRVKHPNVQPFYGVWWPQQEPLPALVSPWQKNGNMKTYLGRSSTTLSEEELAQRKLDLLEGVLLGLMYLHSQDIIHADLRPEKVLISSDGNPLLSGFGTAWTSLKVSVTFTLNHDAGPDSVVYMAPELLDEKVGDVSQYSHKSDIWAYGCLLFAVMSGLEPYNNKPRFTSVIAALQREEFFPRPAGFKDSYWALVRSCCSFDVKERVPASFVLEKLRNLRRDAAPSDEAAERTYQRYVQEAGIAGDFRTSHAER